jgi:hypothetical protein
MQKNKLAILLLIYFLSNNFIYCCNKHELIDDLYYEKREIVCDKLEEYSDSVSDIKKESIQRWIDNEKNPDETNKIKDRISLLFFNKRGNIFIFGDIY